MNLCLRDREKYKKNLSLAEKDERVLFEGEKISGWSYEQAKKHFFEHNMRLIFYAYCESPSNRFYRQYNQFKDWEEFTYFRKFSYQIYEEVLLKIKTPAPAAVSPAGERWEDFLTCQKNYSPIVAMSFTGRRPMVNSWLMRELRYLDSIQQFVAETDGVIAYSPKRRFYYRERTIERICRGFFACFVFRKWQNRQNFFSEILSSIK